MYFAKDMTNAPSRDHSLGLEVVNDFPECVDVHPLTLSQVDV